MRKIKQLKKSLYEFEEQAFWFSVAIGHKLLSDLTRQEYSKNEVVFHWFIKTVNKLV